MLKTKNILSSFDEFAGNEILTDFDFQDYQSVYLGIYEKYRKNKKADAEQINDDIEFEIELVKSIEVNIDYILMLVEKNHGDNINNKELEIRRAIDSSPSLRNKKDLILDFIASLTVDSTITDEWKTYIENKKEKELNEIIEEEKLKPEETKYFMKEAFKNGEIKEKGMDVVKVLPSITMFGVGRGKKKERVIQRFIDFFNRFWGL